ncbi:MAG: hypothetical protein KJ955_03855 [Nanoarchaeota archaeon]|nr:hypothetical protein [Nanoarchaeota archaeon]
MTAKILIVEDQKLPLKALEGAVKSAMPGESYDVARCYSGAEGLIANNNYSIVLLDHRMPYSDISGLEDRDFEAFSNTLEDIGYGLIPLIKQRNPNAVVIGTSSMENAEGAPEYRMRKGFREAKEDLEMVLKETLMP